MTNWELHGTLFANCNCDYSCPCQFNALPTSGACQAVLFGQVDNGYHGAVRLGGTRVGMVVSWPGAVHEGKGSMQPFIDASASPEQREALVKIMAGEDTAEMGTAFWVYSKMCDTIHPPIFTTVDIDLNIKNRTAQCHALDVARTRAEPIRNPITGGDHQVGIFMDNGFEYTDCEVGRGWSESKGVVSIKHDDSYAQWCELHWNQDGVIRQNSARQAVGG